MNISTLLTRFFFVLVAASLMLPALTSAKSRDTIRVALMADPERVDYLRGGQNARPLWDAMHCRLLGEYDPDQPTQRILQLAEKVEVAPDRKRIVIKMKNGFVFHNGDPVTAHDVLFTYNQLRDPANASPIAPLLRQIGRAHV